MPAGHLEGDKSEFNEAEAKSALSYLCTEVTGRYRPRAVQVQPENGVGATGLFEEGRFREPLSEKLTAGYALAANEYWELKRIYPLDVGIGGWDVIEVGIADGSEHLRPSTFSHFKPF